MINVRNLTKKYNNFVALDGLTFSVESGNIVGFLGPNGAGKSTTMRILAGYMPPTSGTASITGIDVVSNSFEVKKNIGYLPEDNPLYPDMTPLEYLEFCGRIRNMEKRFLSERLREVIGICGLSPVLLNTISTLSKGYRQRVGIAGAILHDPPVLVLDEPTSGLDPNQIQEIRALIKSLRGQKSIILSTHIMQEVQAICQRIIIINKGRIVADGTHDELARGSGNVIYEVQLAGPYGDVFRELENLKSIITVKKTELGFNLECAWDCDPRREIFKLAVEKDWPILMLNKTRQSLEDVFRSLTAEG